MVRRRLQKAKSAKTVSSKMRRRCRTNLKLSEKRTAQFCRLIATGLPPDGACDYLGIQPDVFREWIRKGELYVQGDQEPKEYAIYGHFYLELRKAFARYRKSIIGRLHRGEKNWTCWMTILERRDRTSFSRNDPGGSEFDDYDPDERFL